MASVLHGAPWLSAMARIFDQAGGELYVVGGGVRNPLMGLPLSDVDVCGPLKPEEVCALCEGTQVQAHLRAAHFGTVELHIADETGRHMAEYTTWREDSYRCGHKPESVKFTDDIRVDARRRDFSVNALYRRVHDGWVEDVIDPTGGLEHLRQGILHTVTDDPDQVLKDDGLRILRAARFQAELDLEPTPALMDSLRRYAHLLRDIAPERLRDELGKTLMADLRYPQLARKRPATLSGLRTIDEISAWPYLLHEVPWDENDGWALSRFPAELPLRMALLMRSCDPDDARKMMLDMRFSQRDAAKTAACIGAMQQLSAPPRVLAGLGMEALQGALGVFRALNDHAMQCAVMRAISSLEGKPLSLRELAITGNDLKPLFEQTGRPLREMGQLLDHLWTEVLENRLENKRDALLAAAKNR
ncbi:MAG: CCA tRNA nucleotidyltransferase [Clostridia bacterium]|nr:CCA tRNA nucleotidyltransferase [Clostridia bacterium]